jgi:predicted acylesterase/phospholipase RssA
MSTKEKFDVVLLSGGGIKGIGELGILHYYYERGMLDLSHVTEFVGTSIGSLINLLMICGYTPMEIFTKVYTTTNFFKPGDFANLWSLFNNYGITSIDPLMKIIESMVIEKLGKLPSLSELKKITGKIFTVSVVNVSKTRIEYFDHETQPNLGVVDAVKMSCNLPLIFQKIKYKGDYWVDGGLVDSFPYAAVKNTTKKILGVVVTGTDKDDREDTFINYLYKLVIIPMNTMTQLKTKNMGKNMKLITMIFNGISILNFAVESSKKMDMFMKGYRVAKIEEEKELLAVQGWLWEGREEALELVDNNEWSGEVSSSADKDGWDWDDDHPQLKDKIL